MTILCDFVLLYDDFVLHNDDYRSYNGYRHGIYRIWSLSPSKWMTVCLSWAF